MAKKETKPKRPYGGCHDIMDYDWPYGSPSLELVTLLIRII